MPQGREPEEDEEARSPEESIHLDEAATLSEVYRTDNEMAARLVIDELLGPEGIPAYRHDRISHAFPAPAAMPGEIGIAVPESLAEDARIILRQARADGVLLDDGDTIEGTALA